MFVLLVRAYLHPCIGISRINAGVNNFIILFFLFSQPQNQQQTPSKHQLEPLLHHTQFHPMHHNHQHPGQQNQHAAQFSHNHQCGAPSHLPGIAHVQQSATIPQHMACLQPLSGGHVGGRLHLLVSFFGIRSYFSLVSPSDFGVHRLKFCLSSEA